jgi:hypothetical protein
MGTAQKRGTSRTGLKALPSHETRRRSRATAGSPRRTLGDDQGASRKAGKILGAILLTVLGAAAGVFGSYLVAPWQDRRTETATENAHGAFDASHPAVIVQDVGDNSGDIHGAASAAVYDQASLNDHFLKTFSTSAGSQPAASAFPDSTPVSPIQGFDQDSYPRQPRVYETESFTLVGNHYKPVQITNISARVVQRLQPPSGTLVYVGPQGGSPVETIGFDLDSRDSAARVDEVHTPGPTVTSRHYFAERQIALGRNEHQAISATAVTSQCLCRFVFDVTTDDGHTTTVDDHGKPFEISAFSSHYMSTYGVDITGPDITPCDWPNDCIKRFL